MSRLATSEAHDILHLAVLAEMALLTTLEAPHGSRPASRLRRTSAQWDRSNQLGSTNHNVTLIGSLELWQKTRTLEHLVQLDLPGLSVHADESQLSSEATRETSEQLLEDQTILVL